MPTRVSNPLLLIQRTTAVTVLALTIFIVVRVSFIQGLFRQVTIDGPSMAPHLCGSHFDVTCADCKFVFPCDADHLPNDNLAACPNCGYTANSLDKAELRPADRVIIDRWPLLWKAPMRGAVVAIAVPGTTELAVKRIAALPGERLSIDDGDLFIDGKITRKTPAELTPLRQLIQDNAHKPQKIHELPPRWRPQNENTSWQSTPTGFRATPSADNGKTGWLRYEHWKCTADFSSRGIASPITDNDSYNQGETRRPLNTVTDVLLSCRVRASGQGELFLAASAGDQRFELTIAPRKSVTLRDGDRVLTTNRFRADISHRLVSLEFGLCDQQILLVIDGRTVLRHPYEPDSSTQTEPLHPLAIGTHGLIVEFHEPRVWRDVYYLDPQGLSRRWELPAPLADNEYALLGDNQPVSIDSRHWQPAAIPRLAILGHVYQPFWTSRR